MVPQDNTSSQLKDSLDFEKEDWFMSQERLHSDSYVIVGQISKIELQVLLSALRVFSECITTI